MSEILKGLSQKFIDSLTDEGLNELMIARARIIHRGPTTAELLRDSNNGPAAQAQLLVESDAFYYPTRTIKTKLFPGSFRPDRIDASKGAFLKAVRNGKI